jgi:hypothetical protein
MCGEMEESFRYDRLFQSLQTRILAGEHDGLTAGRTNRLLNRPGLVGCSAQAA